MNLVQGQSLLVIRYGKHIIPDCIEQHINVLNQNGYCWFGKLGTIPSKKTQEIVLQEKNPAVLLYTRGAAYLCGLNAISTERPSTGCPDYYVSELYENGKNPSVYFHLSSIEPIEKNIIDNCFISSNKNPLSSTLMKSMSSFFLVQYGKIEVKNTDDEACNASRKATKNSCKYRINGVCELKSFVNYKYECEKPNNCIKQKN